MGEPGVLTGEHGVLAGAHGVQTDGRSTVTGSTATTGSPRGTGLRLEDVVVEYPGLRSAPPTVAVAGASLTVAPGEVVALLGASGCGKSSLLRAVAGLEPVASGHVAWDGADMDGVPVHERGFGLMFQEGQLFAHLDVARNVEYGLRMQRVPRAARRARVEELLEVVGLPGSGRRAVATMSGGERQRVALARALAPQPQLLLLDEPLSALDRGLRERLAVDLRAALVATGTTALFVTHDHDEAFTVADRVAVMARGHLLQVAAPHDLWSAPASREVAEFLGYQAFLPGVDGPRAVGPSGLVLVGVEGAAASGTVVSSVFRRGRTEVTVDADLGDGMRRYSVVGTAPGAGSTSSEVSYAAGDVVGIAVDATQTVPLLGA
ncbi:ABC transporter ATP-binding protein [Sanguibacter antarcticus]|uniref:ABC-type quaternary amine transporter n=1 Tax=Sanguibacter antarcticus TaxID=372484 RepID=A0A2A9E8C7_9MICO|nr:ABC transporter ATP-binding protein [Sanguibacter antarcticus]PFG34420.1 thiamine transport system ATP-binding protein [Sanguibacter antarcticus]